MDPFEVFFFLFISILLSHTSIAQDVCYQVACGENQPVISFPFRIAEHQPERCGYPGFDLRCSSSGETVINLPSSGEFFVRKINYLQQAIRLYDPDSCLPKRLLEFDLSNSPFQAMFPQNYTFLNCSDSASNQFDQAIDCLSSPNHTVMAIPSTVVVDARLKNFSCKPIKSVLIPTQWPVQFSYEGVSEFGNDILLNWREPNCVDCESFGGNCRFNTNDPLEIGCSNFRSPGEPRIRTTKLPRGLALGLGLPILLLTVILGTYFCIRITAHVQPPPPHIVPSSSAAVLPQPVVITVGLDRPTIESYPKVVLGESRRLPRPDDSTCSICLSDYKPKETLRSIPECQHFFHADCIDRWLHLNSSCPVCRKSPQTEANAT